MTREQAVHKREKLAAQLPAAIAVLRGSLLQRTVHHSSGCLKCARGEGHPLWVLNVGSGGKTRQVSLRPDQVPQVREALENYRTFKRNLEAISELNAGTPLATVPREEKPPGRFCRVKVVLAPGAPLRPQGVGARRILYYRR